MKNSPKSSNSIKGSELLKISTRRLLRFPINALITIFLTLLLFFVATEGLSSYYREKSEYDRADKAFRFGIDHAGVIINESGNPINDNLMEKLTGITGVDGIGAVSISALNDTDLTELVNEQNQVQKEKNSVLKCLMISGKRGARLFNINNRVATGVAPDDTHLDKGEDVIYLGWNYSNYLVGERLGKYYIGGVLLPTSFGFVGDKSILLDNTAIVITQDMSTSDICFFTVIDNEYNSYDIEEITDKIKTEARLCAENIRVISMKEYLDHKLSEHNVTVKKLRWLCIGLMPYIVFVLLLQQMIDMNENKKEIGVMYDCGMKPSEFMRIILDQNILKILPSEMIAVALFWIRIYKGNHYSSAIRFDESIDYKIAVHVTASATFFMVGMIFLTSVVPIIWVYLHKPSDFLKDIKGIGMPGIEESLFVSIAWLIPILLAGSEILKASDDMFIKVIVMTVIFAISNSIYLTHIWIKEKNTEVKVRRDLGQSKIGCIMNLCMRYVLLILVSSIVGCGFSF